jgi:predicted transposase/invertase (TIGR01784 family)
MRFADPKNDVAFKKIFGDENHKEVLISFLNSILDFKDSMKIKDVTIVNPYQVPKIKDLKNTILDIKATNENNQEFIVEMQVEKDKNFAKRSLYYTSKSYVNQIDNGERYPELKKVYFIGILDFAIFDTKNYLSNHLILDTKTNICELKDFEFTFIELKKFNLSLQQCDTIAKKWIYFIQNASSFDLIPKEYENIKEFRTAFNTAKIYNWNKDELEVYDYVCLNEGKKKSEIDTAREDGFVEGKEEGIKEGVKKGIKEGVKKGIKEGVKKGIKEGKLQEKLNIAKNLLDVLDNETIALKTGLTIQQIENLRDK